jgi:hypothetical protein
LMWRHSVANSDGIPMFMLQSPVRQNPTYRASPSHPSASSRSLRLTRPSLACGRRACRRRQPGMNAIGRDVARIATPIAIAAPVMIAPSASRANGRDETEVYTACHGISIRWFCKTY